MVRIPRPNRLRDVLKLEQTEFGFCLSNFIVVEKTVESSGDLARSDKVIPRRSGFDDFLGFFLGCGLESFGVDGVAVSFCSLVLEFSLFVEVPIFDDVVAGLGDCGTGAWSALDVGMSAVEVEIGFVDDVWLLSELDEDMMMRISVGVKFLGNDDVERVEDFEALLKESAEIGVLKVGLSVSQEDVFVLQAERHFGGSRN